jgi:hypothetical protein
LDLDIRSRIHIRTTAVGIRTIMGITGQRFIGTTVTGSSIAHITGTITGPGTERRRKEDFAKAGGRKIPAGLLFRRA